jgi:hypothetical protein
MNYNPRNRPGKVLKRSASVVFADTDAVGKYMYLT